jgi:hypothetical protein
LKSVYTLIALVLAIAVLRPVDLLAQEDTPEITVTAESMTSLPDGTITARGEVTVQGEGVTVRADSLSYNPGSDILMLTGNVVMLEEGGGGSFRGDSLVLDLADLTGGINRGEIIIVPNGFRVRGEDIQRTGPEEYSIQKGVFTSCPGDCPDWSFTASKIQIRKEGYLEARHAAFRIVGIPVFYTPYLLYPVKSQRQTGLLFPNLGFSEETGLETAWPFFITMGAYADATVSLRTFSRDDFGLDVESRYGLDWGGGGQVKGFAMTGERSERWYLKAEHSMALTPDIWIRGRWYDAGESTVMALFGNDFEDRYPGSIYRHATLEGDYGFLGYGFQTSSLLTDGTLARSDLPASDLERNAGTLRIGPGGGDLWRIGVSAEEVSFENGESRTIISPMFALRFPGPYKLAGQIQGRGIIGTGGDGSAEDEAYLLTIAERVAAESSGDWGKHRVDLELTASAAQGAAFGDSILRDSKDLVEERRIFDARLSSALSLSGFKWDLMAGNWQDTELDMSFSYGSMKISYIGAFIEASKNRDADFGLVLPSIAGAENAIEGWQVEAGYESEKAGLSIGRDSAEGFPEMFKSNGHFKIAGVRVSGDLFYDLDADALADETITVRIPGRCWSVGIGRSRSPDRTDWKMAFELGL